MSYNLLHQIRVQGKPWKKRKKLLMITYDHFWNEYRIYSQYRSRNFGPFWAIFFSIRLIHGSVTMITKFEELCFIWAFKVWGIILVHKNYFKFWSFFSKYFFNSTYTRVDLYASIYGKLCASLSHQYRAIIFYRIIIFISQKF